MNIMIESIIKTHFPDAKTGAEITETYLNFIQGEYGSQLDKILFATSLCCDDINVSTDFRKVLTRPFTLGGLGGLPYAGLTGITAYAHHVPDGGDAFIFYGPHIGISDCGELGKLRRPGQEHLTNSCGALVLALERLNNNSAVVPEQYELDGQQLILERSLRPLKDAGAQHVKIHEALNFTYHNIRTRLLSLIKASRSEFNCERIFLLGGIIINTSPEFHDFVDIKNFEVLNPKQILDPDITSILASQAFKDL
jgi:hypothetical protein